MMKRNNWIPLWSGIVSLVIGLASVDLLPRQSCPAEGCSSTYITPENTTLLQNAASGINEDTNSSEGLATPVIAEPSSPRGDFLAFLQEISDKVKSCLRGLAWIPKSPRKVRLCLTIFLFTTLAKESLDILIQYISKRYEVSIAEVCLFEVSVGIS
jgi:hypothetical protein